ncbi:alpha/beta hydrolase [Rubrivirga sp. S365]|uniref:Alpha/beta hydrolase n=1 Tax=Rubrivirga litoralis TaxID=3075598 RepID=A0ABU3BUT7_9BACT|nr:MULTISPECIES: alpha/beta fold hydrolase [unclassified Rubrivirga]MDT0633057.1 alpha/beta hydrolase [Rubrivirga sp. F394]MDT7857124.1 alpha/beta hydrolase [Rubrivirga sp. S365]
MTDLPPYRPPRPLRSGHVQSVLPTLFRRVRVAYRRERLELADGDLLDLDWTGSSDGARVAVVAHGLEGSTDRAYVRGMARALARRGWTVCAWNLRGCSGEPNRLARTYHSGVSDDLDAVVRRVLDRPAPGGSGGRGGQAAGANRGGGARAVAVVGFSLGGNVTLKWLGERGGDVDRRVVGGVGISVPVDLASASAVMERPSRRVYMARFLRSLGDKVADKAARHEGVPDAGPIRGMRSFREFDGHVTAPLHGFDSAEDYWTRASSLPLLGAIRVPTLLVQALDDPFLSPACYPRAEAARNPSLTLLTPEHGGHVGFVERGGEFWSETVTSQFLDAALLPTPRSTTPPGA